VQVGANVVVAGQGGRPHALKASVFAKREFAGYWEYVLDEAIFTAPAHPQWGGSALIGADGKLLGIGSLLVQEKIDAGTLQGNMIVPIDLLEPILEDMTRLGRPDRPPRPWLGLYVTEAGAKLVVAGLAPGGPAARAGVQVGDIVAQAGGGAPASLADLFRRIWRSGNAGAEVALKLVREGKFVDLRVVSGDRNDFLKKPHLH
jgi:S1-C subfamily serine protease